MFALRSICAVAILAAAQPALAQDGNGVSVNLGLGAGTGPAYFGSDETMVSPTGAFSLNSLQLGSFGLGGGDPYGLGFHGGFRYIGERSAADYPELTGLADVPLSVELGGGVNYTTPEYELFADVRYGVVGHESFVGEFGGDIYIRPSEQLTLSAGPRVFVGSDDYASTYFGVTAAESMASGGAFNTFDARGGILSAGFEAAATYDFNDDWGVTGTVRYDQLREDAALSPITRQDDQFSASIVVTRDVTFGF